MMYDPNGSLVNVAGSSGTLRYPSGGYASGKFVSAPVLYDAYGMPVWHDVMYSYGYNWDAMPFGYKGQAGYVTDFDEIGDGPVWQDPTPILVYCHHRFYDPQSGRWLTPDPAGLEGGVNLYEFCDGNPLMNVDPSGLSITQLLGAFSFHVDTQADLWNKARDGRNEHRRFPDMRHAEIDVFGNMHILPPDTSLKQYNTNLFIGAVSSGRRIPAKVWRQMFEDEFGYKVPVDAFGKNYEACHIKALADGGPDTYDNIQFLDRLLHRYLHVMNGDYARWAKRARFKKGEELDPEGEDRH
jgi:RHS repeat-associated protein